MAARGQYLARRASNQAVSTRGGEAGRGGRFGPNDNEFGLQRLRRLQTTSESMGEPTQRPLIPRFMMKRPNVNLADVLGLEAPAAQHIGNLDIDEGKLQELAVVAVTWESLKCRLQLGTHFA